MDTFAECAPALKNLEQFIGNDGEAAQYIKQEMNDTAEEKGLRLHGVDITKTFAKMLTSVEPSHDNSGRPSGRSAHKGLNHTHFLWWTTEERQERVKNKEADEDSKMHRTETEAKKKVVAGARRTPATYTDLSTAVEGYYCFLATLFPKATITNDYRMLNELLQSMIEDTDVLEKQRIMSLSWIMLGNCAQYWSVRTSADNVYDRKNLPQLTLHFIIPGPKINKNVPLPSGVPKE